MTVQRLALLVQHELHAQTQEGYNPLTVIRNIQTVVDKAVEENRSQRSNGHRMRVAARRCRQEWEPRLF